MIRALTHRVLAHRVRAREPITDAEFDDVYPLSVRWLSSPFWTPVAVGLRVASLLASRADMRILDIGAGPGKFCILGALATRATFVGVEHRESLVGIARATAARYGADRADFVHGVFDDLDPTDYDGMYLFNPFEENLWDAHARVDQSVVLSARRFRKDLEAVDRFLARARVGTRVATYHGFGADPPPSYRHVLRERCGSDYVDLWEQTDRSRGRDAA